MATSELRRRSDGQCKDDFEPLLNHMIELGCLASQDKKIGIGDVSYEQVRLQLAEKLMMSVPVDIFPDVSALMNKQGKAMNGKTSPANTVGKKHRAAA